MFRMENYLKNFLYGKSMIDLVLNEKLGNLAKELGFSKFISVKLASLEEMKKTEGSLRVVRADKEKRVYTTVSRD
jgi:hypothetical protein